MASYPSIGSVLRKAWKPDEMDDRRAEFLIAVGGMCDAAQRAGLGVVVRTQGGARVAGVPMIGGADSTDELGETGYARTFWVDDAQIALDEVVSCTISAPAGPRAGSPAGPRAG